MTPVASVLRIFLLVAGLLGTSGAFGQYSCAASSGNVVNFLTYAATAGAPTTASTPATLTCTHLGGAAQKIVWQIELSNGNSGNCNARVMNRTGPPIDTLSYNIYQDSVAGGVWGNAGCAGFPAGQMTVANGVGNNTRSVTVTLFGQIPVGQFVSAGFYSDTLILTFTY